MTNTFNWQGVWPTMITPFHEDKTIDYNSLEKLIEWYIAHGVAGLFAVCQSSEMFALSLEERVQLAAFVVKHTAGRVPVIASGHISDTLEGQLEEIGEISKTGIDAFVLVSNRLASSNESDEVWIANLQKILHAFPAIRFGLYECPYPYKRLLSQHMLKFCAESGQILFLKDTCCDDKLLQQRLRLVQNTTLRLFNANSTTLLSSLEQGAAGYSGVMANIHPDLYVWLVENDHSNGKKAQQLQYYLTLSSLVEHLAYPISAKYYLQKMGVIRSITTRTKDEHELNAHMKLVIDQLALSDNSVRQESFL